MTVPSNRSSGTDHAHPRFPNNYTSRDRTDFVIGSDTIVTSTPYIPFARTVEFMVYTSFESESWIFLPRVRFHHAPTSRFIEI